MINWRVVIGTAIIALICLILFVLWRRYQRIRALRILEKRPAHVIAYEELHELKEEDLPHKGLVKEYYSRLSDIARHYLENRFLYRAPEMTTEEFLVSIKEAKELKKDQKKLLKNFLSHCDMVKFAKYGPSKKEIDESYESAEELVDETKEEEDVEK